MRPEKIPRPAPDQLPAIIESLLFVAEEAQEIGTLSKTLNTPRQGIERAIEALIESTAGRGIYVQRNGDRVQLSTTPEAAPYIEHFLEVEHGRLSRASLETLAIIAYRQPATRGTVESVRGVNSDHSVATLLARELIEDVGRALLLSSQGQVAWHNDIAEGFYVTGDYDQLFRVFLNLGRNAMDAMGEGQGEVRISAGWDQGKAIIEIADTGPGLSERARDHLFEPFVGSTRPGGSGLGLPIVREIMHAHGGAIRIARSNGSGAVIRLVLPGQS